VRLGVVASASLVLLHVARPSDVILLLEPAQDLWPVPVLRPPAVDMTLVEATVMEGWAVAPTVVTAEEVRSDRFLWREMFFRNWDRLPSPLREEGLAAMPESENPDGTRDIGIGQASAPTRSRIRVLFVRGVSDFGLAEDDYFDPWKATRALVHWFSLLLEEAARDVDVATRAYNLGTKAARAGAGSGYLDEVRRRERDYVRGRGSSPSWRWLRERSPSPCPAPADARGPAASGALPSAERR
jgi:hypothetical protein